MTPRSLSVIPFAAKMPVGSDTPNGGKLLKPVKVLGLPKKTVLKNRRRKLAHQRAFLDAYEKTYCITWAVRAAGVTRKTHYRWLEQDSGYAAAFKRTQMIAGDTLESVAIERATVGWTEPIYFRGEKCGEVRKFDDAMLMFLLRGLMPEKYGHRVQIQPPSVAAPSAQPKVEVVFAHSAHVALT
jgi:hypothetical protein